MKKILFIFPLLLLGATTLVYPPLPPTIPKIKYSWIAKGVPTHVSGAANYINKIAVKTVIGTETNTISTNDFPIIYPAGIVASNYYWDIITCSNLSVPRAQWTIVQSNCTGTVTVYQTNLQAYWNFRGHK